MSAQQQQQRQRRQRQRQRQRRPRVRNFTFGYDHLSTDRRRVEFVRDCRSAAQARRPQPVQLQIQRHYKRDKSRKDKTSRDLSSQVCARNRRKRNRRQLKAKKKREKKSTSPRWPLKKKKKKTNLCVFLCKSVKKVKSSLRVCSLAPPRTSCPRSLPLFCSIQNGSSIDIGARVQQNAHALHR